MMAERLLPSPCRRHSANLMICSFRPHALTLPGSPTLLVGIDIDTYSGCLLVRWNVDSLTAVCVVALLLCGVLLVGEKVQVRAIWTQLHCGHRLLVKYLSFDVNLFV